MPEKFRRTCRQCGAGFETGFQRTLYCSTSCRQKWAYRHPTPAKVEKRKARKKARNDYLNARRGAIYLGTLGHHSGKPLSSVGRSDRKAPKSFLQEEE
jgi:hypothetical protein